MKLTIIGAGNMGRGIATRAIAGGHEVEILDRDSAEARALGDELGDSANSLDASGAFATCQGRGREAIDVGPLGRAQQLEQLGFLDISIQQPLGLGFASAIKLHP